MKYIEEEVEPYILVGERLVIDGIESGIVLWHVDYFIWLEKQFEELNNKYTI